MQLEIKRKFYYCASIGLFSLMLTQAFQLTRHFQMIPELPQAFEVTKLDTTYLKDGNNISLVIDGDLRNSKTQYPLTWFNPISRIFLSTETKSYSFISATFLGINFTYPGIFLLYHLIEMSFTTLLFFYCLFNRRHYKSSFFDSSSTMTAITLFTNNKLCTANSTSTSIRVARNRSSERWYLFKDEKKLGPYTLDQVEYLADEKTAIKDFMCMSTYDHRVYKVKNIIEDE